MFSPVWLTPPEKKNLPRRALRPGKEDSVEPETPEKKVEEEETLPAEKPFNPLSWLTPPWHLLMVVFYCLLLRQGYTLMDEKAWKVIDPEGKMPPFGGRFKFLSHINEWVQLGFFAVQLLADVSPGPFKTRLQKLADFYFTTIAFPLATFVTAAFWGLYALDRSLVFPEVWDKVTPQYMNHFWHTTILLWVLSEIYLVHHHFPTTGWASASIFFYGSAYIAWVVYIYINTEWWCYPFMKHLPPYAMALFFATCMFSCLALYLLGKLVSRLRWGVTKYL